MAGCRWSRRARITRSSAVLATASVTSPCIRLILSHAFHDAATVPHCCAPWPCWPRVLLPAARSAAERAASAALKPRRPSPSGADRALAGQSVAVMPLTLVVADPALSPTPSTLPTRTTARRSSGPTRSSARRSPAGRPRSLGAAARAPRRWRGAAPGIVDDPDQMGQAVLRSPKITTVPDPLRSSLRNLMAWPDGRRAWCPPRSVSGREADGQIRADLTLVVADTRTRQGALARAVPRRQRRRPRAARSRPRIAAVLPLDVGGP